MSDETPERPARVVGSIAPAVDTRDSIATGFPSVDNALGGGLRRGDLVVLAGEVGSGKSALALAVALRASESGGKVLFMSGEMEQARLAERALAIEARVRVDDLRRGTLDEEARARAAMVARKLESRSPALIAIEPGGEDFVAKVFSDADADAALLIVDPLQALATGARPQDEELAATTRALKRLARDRNVCVLATTYLPTLPRDRKDPRPQLDDLGTLGALKQFADVVLGLYRHEMYESAPDVDGATELIVLKNRNGALGYVDLFFYKHWMRFEDMLEPDR